MEERDRLVKTRFPAEIADIIIGYATVFKRPFQRDRCSQCDKRSTHFELCRDHHNLCLFCCDNTARIIQDDEENVPTYLVCQACEALYGSSWLKYTEHSCDSDSTCEDMYQTLYRNDDYPVDIEYFKQGLLILGMAHEEGRNYNKDAREAFEQYGGLEAARKMTQKLPDWFENTEIFSRWKEAERDVGSFTWSTVEKLIRKL